MEGGVSEAAGVALPEEVGELMSVRVTRFHSTRCTLELKRFHQKVQYPAEPLPRNPRREFAT